MAPIPEVIAALDEIRLIHEKKNADYSSGGPFENFDRAANIIAWFKNDRDKTFVNHIATKLARLATLLSSNQVPNNESIDDSFLDLATYCILWGARYKQERNIIKAFIDKEKNND